MKRFTFSAAITFALLSAFAAMARPAFAASRCDRPNGALDQRVCAKAAEGPDALRRFVQRTRMIHALYYYDYARERAPAAAIASAAPPTRKD